MAEKAPVKVTAEIPKRLTKEQIADLKQRLRCAVVLSYPERLRLAQVIVQNRFRTSPEMKH